MDVKDITQLVIFVWGINSEFIITEELVKSVLLIGSTTEQDIFYDFYECASKMQLDLRKLVSVTIDIAPAVVGSKNAFVFVLEKYATETGSKHSTLKFYCIIHQEILSPKSGGFADIMEVIKKAVNLFYPVH